MTSETDEDEWSTSHAGKIFSYWLYSPCGPWPLISFLIYSHLVGLLGRVISPSQGAGYITLGNCLLINEHHVIMTL
jgi:hypothetical protein